jgi:integrase
LHHALREILAAIPESERGVFVIPEIANDYTGARWKISQGIAQIFDSANITTSIQLEGRSRKTPEATFHSLRHTFVSLAANAGVPLHIVQSIVGHESTAMTRHYYHENVDSLRMAVNAIPNL